MNLDGILLPEKSDEGKIGLKKLSLLFTVLSFDAREGKWCLYVPLSL